MMRLLEEQGWQPRECDVQVPVYGNRVPCGRPLDVADAFVERHMSLPHTIVRSIKAYVIQAKGNSMEDMGISDGDELLVELCDTACDNEAVLVMLDGEMMIKLFVRDEHGEVWLVPRNRAFRPIHVQEGMDFSIRARVLKVLKDTLRAPFGEIQALISEAAKAEQRKEQRSKGRPRHLAFEDCMTADNREEHLRRLSHCMEGQKGKRAAFIIQTARRMGWLTEIPAYESIKGAFGDIGARSNFMKYVAMKMTEEEEMDIEGLMST